MQLERLIAFFATSPAIRLLRSPNAPYIVDFLNQSFKDSGSEAGRLGVASLTWRHSELVSRLAGFQERINAEGADVLRNRAEAYLSDWSSGDTRWLARRLEAGVDEPVYELSPHTEVVLRFLREILQKRLGFVGTESRLRRIIETLSSLAIRGSNDPQRRLAYLRSERERIDAEIQAIESKGIVSTLSPTGIRERFADAVDDLLHLQGDFRAVEDSFKQITRSVQRRQAESNDSRGHILGYALDAEDRLKTDDQGVSFHEFVRLILSPAKQEELERIIDGLDEISELADQLDGLRHIHGMVPSLLIEAQKVLKTTQRLSTTLRRLLDTQAASSRMRLTHLLRDIRQAASRLAENPPADSVGLKVETELDLGNVSERSFWSPAVRFDANVMHDAKTDEDDRLAAFKTLALMRRLDWTSMRGRIQMSLGKRKSVSMLDLFQQNPPNGGVIEVLGFLQIAHDDGHHVDPVATDTIELPIDDFVDIFDRPTTLKSLGGLRITRHQTLNTNSNDLSMRTLVLEIPRVVFLNHEVAQS
jgi:hypothetical protein